jgi:hypothetical protein
MPSSIITAGDASNGLVVASGNDGAEVIQSGPAGAKVNALVIAVDGKLTEIIRSGNASIGKVVQVVNFQTGAVATGTTLIPGDDTIPQITEGDEYMTLAITPTASTNILLIEVGLNMGATNAANNELALFVGTTANALASAAFYINAAQITQGRISNTMVAGVTSALTFRTRAGREDAGTLTVNGYSGVRRHGGVMLSFMRITEYTPA